MGRGREAENHYFDLGVSVAVRGIANVALYKMYETAHSVGFGGPLILFTAIINAWFATESIGKSLSGSRGGLERMAHGALGASSSLLIVYLLFIHHEPGFLETWSKKAGDAVDAVKKTADSWWDKIRGDKGETPSNNSESALPKTQDNNQPSPPSQLPAQTGTAAAPTEGAPTQPPAPTSATHPIETSVTVADGQGDIKLLRALGDDLFAKLKAMGLTDEQIRNFFPENSLQDRLVTARLDGNLGTVSEQISIESGNYRPGAPADSRNVFKGSRLVLNKDGSVTRVWDGGSEMVSDSEGHLKRYTGRNMITPRRG